MDVNEDKGLLNITLRYNWGKGAACSKKVYGCKWKWKTIEHYTTPQIEVKEQLAVRNYMGVDENERLSTITLRHKFKKRNSV
jgi:hypothetical protein